MITYGYLTAGDYSIEEIRTEELLSEMVSAFYSSHCINKERNLYVFYNSDYYTPVDMKEWMFVVKYDSNNNFLSLTKDDIAYIKKYHWQIWQVYCWQTHETIMVFAGCNAKPDFTLLTNKDEDVVEIQNGYQIIFDECVK